MRLCVLCWLQGLCGAGFRFKVVAFGDVALKVKGMEASRAGGNSSTKRAPCSPVIAVWTPPTPRLLHEAVDSRSMLRQLSPKP